MSLESKYNIVTLAKQIKSGKFKVNRLNFIMWAFVSDVVVPLMQFKVLVALWRFIRFPFIVNIAYKKFIKVIERRNDFYFSA